MAQKNQQAAEARAKAQAQVKAGERRTTVIVIAVALVVILGFAGIVYFIVSSSKVGDLPDVHSPAPADASGGIAVGTGGVVGEDVPSGVTRVDLYLDPMCPVCKAMESTNAEDLDALREAGTIELVYHPVSILNRYSAGTEYPTRAANALAVVAEQDPSHFLAFLSSLYDNQPEENTPGLTDDQIAAIAVGVGVPEEVASTFKKGEFEKWVTAATDQGSQDGMSGTPTAMVNGEVIDYKKFNYFYEPGVLKSYIESHG